MAEAWQFDEIDDENDSLDYCDAPSPYGFSPLASPPSPCRAPRYRAAVIFDWDDTLLASSSLFAAGFNVVQVQPCLPATLAEGLCRLEQSIIRLFQQLEQMSDVFFCIVTNAQQGWVELSASRVFPTLANVIKAMNIPIMSARTAFENVYPSNPIMWKAAAFMHQLTSTFCLEFCNSFDVLALGDTESDREAAKSFAECVPANVRVRFVKTLGVPSAHLLFRQTCLLSHLIDQLLNSNDASDDYHIFLDGLDHEEPAFARGPQPPPTMSSSVGGSSIVTSLALVEQQHGQQQQQFCNIGQSQQQQQQLLQQQQQQQQQQQCEFVQQLPQQLAVDSYLNAAPISWQPEALVLQ